MRLVTLDFETYYDKEYSLSKLTTEQYVRDPRFEVILVGAKVNDLPPAWFSGTMEQTKAWLLNLGIEHAFLLAHHTAFDAFILTHHFGIKPKFYLDTLSMARPIHNMTVGGSLKALSDFYTIGVKGDEVVHAIGKRRIDFSPAELKQYGHYCMNDVQLTYMLFQILKREIPKDEIKVIDLFVRMFVEPVLELDRPFLETHLAEVRTKRAALIERLGFLGGKAEIMSNPKFANLLRGLGVEPPTKISRTTGKPTFAFSKQDLEFKALLLHPDELVRTAVEVRLGLKSTIEETRTEAFLGISERGAWPVYLNYYGAHTGRASGGDGVNPQNLHRGGALRKAVKAPKGHKIISADSSQIEARVNAWLAGQEDLVDDFRNKVDIYSKFAGDVYGYKVVKESHPTERFVGKTCILGLGYGMGYKKLQHTLQLGLGGPPVTLPLVQCGGIVDLYRSKYRRIQQLWQVGDKALYAIVKGEEFSFGRGLLKTSSAGIHLPNGMVIRYPGLTFVKGDGFVYAKNRREQAEWVKQNLSGQWNAELLTRIYGGKVIENVVQALARIIVFEQMLKIAPIYRVALTVHDEVVTCVPEEQVRTAVEFVETTMHTPPTWAQTLPIACDVHSGETYGAAK